MWPCPEPYLWLFLSLSFPATGHHLCLSSWKTLWLFCSDSTWQKYFHTIDTANLLNCSTFLPLISLQSTAPACFTLFTTFGLCADTMHSAACCWILDCSCHLSSRADTLWRQLSVRGMYFNCNLHHIFWFETITILNAFLTHLFIAQTKQNCVSSVSPLLEALVTSLHF